MNFISAFLSLFGSVILGGLIVTFLSAQNKKSLIKLLLAFSGGFLLSVAFVHFLPELYDSSFPKIGVFILLGFLVQLVLEFFSGGIEHGHVHVHKGQAMPWALFISLSVHSFIEGIPLGAQYAGQQLDLAHGHSHDADSLLFGILFHQLPVAIALMTLLVSTRVNRVESWIVLLLFGLMTPGGMLLGYLNLGLGSYFDFNIVLAIVVGMFLHISTTIIFETSENHKFNLLKLTAIVIGCGLAFLMQ